MIDVAILTGPKHSGKTTALRDWADARAGRVGGVLAPDVDGLRRLYFPASKEKCAFEVAASERTRYAPADLLEVGRFTFLRSAFAKTRTVLLRNLANPNLLTVVVDEVGPLELRGGGHDGALREVLGFGESLAHNPTLLLVVRDSLVKEVINHYALGAALQVIGIDGLKDY